MKRQTLLVAVTAVMISACGGPAASSGAAATPFIPFPGHDTPLSMASGAQAEVWASYEVGSIPGQGTVDSLPTPPPVLNATNGAVPNEVATQWAQDYYRDEGWREWADANAEGLFLRHVDGEADEYFELTQGKTVLPPPCAIWPTAMTLIGVQPDFSGKVNGSDTYAWLTTFTPPAHQACTTQVRTADGSLSPDQTFSKPVTYLEKGAVHDDPLLGNIWITDQREPCTFTCPTGLKRSTLPPPAFPDDDTPLAQATAQQAAVWRSYNVTQVPRKGVLFNVPQAPKVINDTDGVIPQTLAQTWAQDFYQQASWTKWSYERAQEGFQQHIGDSTAFDGDLVSFINNGGIPAMPTCALYPTKMELSIISPDQRRLVASGTARGDEFVFDIGYDNPCTVTAIFPDGSSQEATTPKEALVYGSVREDPMLGSIFFPDLYSTALQLG